MSISIMNRGTLTRAGGQRLDGSKRNIADALFMSGLDEIEFDPPRLNDFPIAAQFDECIGADDTSLESPLT